MEAQGVWDAIDPAAGVAVEFRRDKMALAAIYQGILKDALLLVAEKRTAKEAWDTLRTMHLGADRVKKARVQTLKTEFDSLRMKDNEKIDDFGMKFISVINKIRSLGDKMEEVYVVSKLLRAVPGKFLQVVSTIEQFGDIDNMSLEEALGRLKAHEERINILNDAGGSHLLLTQEEWTAKMKKGGGESSSDAKGRDRNGGSGRGHGRGRGRGRGNN